MNVALGNEVHPELKALLECIKSESSGMTTCRLPGCGRPWAHIRHHVIRFQIGIDLFFCSEEHRKEAETRWGLIT